MGPRSTQDRSKTGPRSSWIAFFHLEFSIRFLIVLGSILVPFGPPKWSPGGAAELVVGAAELVVIDPWRSKTVLGSSWFGPFFVLSFGIALLVILGSFWGRFGALRGSFWCFFGSSTHRFNPSTHQLVDSTHQLINLSTHQPMALRHFLTRPGGLRAARLNNLSRLVFSACPLSCQL